jgi:VWFA-related protein
LRHFQVALLAMIIGLAAQFAAAQDEAGDPTPIGGLGFVDEIDVRVVNVDVFVRDSAGRPVTGLGREDFRLLQDGGEVPISNFAVLSKEVFQSVFSSAPREGPPLEAAAAERPIEIRPIFVILYLDNENLRPMDRNRVLRRVRSFVTENLEGPVQMMVVSYQRSLDVAQPFTDDPRAVNDALRGMTRMSGGMIERDTTRRAIIADLQEAKEGTGATGRDQGPAAIRQRIYLYADEEANNLTFTLGAIRQAIAMLSGIEGRKSIIHISSGLPMSPGLGLMQEYASVFDDNSVMANRSILDRTRAFHELAAAANAQEVSLYTIDAEGLNPLDGGDAESAFGRDPVAASSAAKNFKDSLRYLADATGGLAIINTNDVTAGLEKIAADLFDYYSLGYVLKSGDRDRVHRLTVEVPAHPKYDLRYRHRFVEKSRATMVQDRVFSSLMVDVDDNLMELELTPGRPEPAAGTRWGVPLHLSFPLEKVALLELGGDYVGRVVLFIGAQDIKGRNSEIQRQEHEVRIPAADYEKALRQRFGIDFKLLLDEGQQRVAVGLMDQITRRASYERIVVTVP